MAKAAAGLADDLASTTLLATDKRVLMAPAMNVRMWTHPATRRNLARLKADGVRFVGPTEGAMACGEYGEGRLAEPDTIADAVLAILDERSADADVQPLAGRRILVTAGPTREAIDPVRYLSNYSSGKQGYAVAQALAGLGAEVTLVSGPTALAAPLGVRGVEVESARDMAAACDAALPVDAAVLVAAVADWRPEAVASDKLKKAAGAVPQTADAGGESRHPGRTLPPRPAPAKGWWSASPRRPRRWRPTPAPNWRARAATGCWPTT